MLRWRICQAEKPKNEIVGASRIPGIPVLPEDEKEGAQEAQRASSKNRERGRLNDRNDSPRRRPVSYSWASEDEEYRLIFSFTDGTAASFHERTARVSLERELFMENETSGSAS